MRVDRQWRIVFPSLFAAGVCAHCEPIGVACRESRTSGKQPNELPRELLGEQQKKALERDGILGINRAGWRSVAPAAATSVAAATTTASAAVAAATATAAAATILAWLGFVDRQPAPVMLVVVEPWIAA